MVSGGSRPQGRSLLWWVTGLILCALLTAGSSREIGGQSIKGDATQNMKIAYNLFHNGHFSLHGKYPEHAPTSFREPVPPVFTAVYLKLVLDSHQTYEVESWHNGAYTRLIKLGNLFWVFTGLVGTWLLASRLMRSPVASALAVGLAYLFFFDLPGVVNSLYTELPAGTLMIWSALALVVALESRRIKHAVLAGVVLGLLCLTKNAFQVVAPAVIVLSAAVAWLQTRKSDPWPVFRHLVIPALMAFAAVITPWIIRNKIVMGSTEISSGRSGYVMYKRALMDHMSDTAFKKGFYLYGPRIYKTAVAGSDWAITNPKDLLRGGALQWLNPTTNSDFQNDDNQAIYEGRPDKSFTYYRKSAAVYQQLKKILEEGHHPTPDLTADLIMQRVAKQQWMADPVAHLKITVLLLWRGFWWAPSHVPDPIPGAPDISHLTAEWVNLTAGLSLYLLFAIATVRRHAAVFATTAVPVFMLGVHALATQNLPRFTLPAIPFMLLALVYLLWEVVQKVGLRSAPPA